MIAEFATTMKMKSFYDTSINVPATITIRQGEAMGRPSRLTVHIPATGGIVVTGTAVSL